MKNDKQDMFAKRYTRVLAGLAGTIGSTTAIVTLLVTAFGLPIRETTIVVAIVDFVLFIGGYMVDRMITRVNKALDERLVTIREDIAKNELAAQERSRVHDLALCRLELSDLMNNDPDNKLAIEKKARHYFCELGGNDNMSDRFSKWARDNGGDVSVMLCSIEKL